MKPVNIPVVSSGDCWNNLTLNAEATRRALGGAHVPPSPTKVFRRLTASVNETIVKPRIAAATNTYTSDIPT